MQKINLEDIDKVFDTIKVVNKKKPSEWQNSIIEQFRKDSGIEEFRQMAKLKAIVQNFVIAQNIYCAETIYQTDRVIENAYEFIEDLVEIVGYLPDDDE